MKNNNCVTQFVTKHSPEIFTGLGIAGLVGTAVLAAKAQPKALALLEEAKEEKGEELTIVEKVKTSWKCYIPAVTTGVASVVFLVGANNIHARRNAAIATAYKISEVALTEYKNKVVETIGEKQEKVIREEVNKDRLAQNPVVQSEVVVTKKGGTTRCYDHSSGRRFMSDRLAIEKAVVRLNERMFQEMWISLNDFYDEIGLERTSTGEILGWTISKGRIELQFDSQLDTDGEPCLVVDFANAPYYEYDKIL